MAGDWIKVEHTTPDKPEVVMLSSILEIDQDAVVGKLIRIWAWADQNSIDGNALCVTHSFLDRLTASPGFALGLVKVGWLSGREGRLVIPNFDRHNGQTAKGRAVTNRRVASHRREQRNDGIVTDDGTPPLQKPLPEKRREEKRKQEQKHSAPVGAGSQIEPLPEPPDWIPREAWDGFVSMRRRERHPLTARAAKLLVGKLEKLKAAGHNPGDLLDKSTLNGWRDVYAPDERKGSVTPFRATGTDGGYVPMPGEL